jgi:hypothetical protein
VATLYYYVRNHERFGPVTSDQLKELAASGELRPDDLLWKAGMEKAEPAARFKGLFPQGPPAAGPESRPVATPVLAPVNGRVSTATAAPAAGRLAALQPVLEHYSRQYDIARRPLVALALGGTGLVLLFVTTLLTWTRVDTTGGKALPVVVTETETGLESAEGKLIGVLILLALGSLGVALFVKRLLPAAILVAAAVGTCSVILALSCRHQVMRSLAEEERALELFRRNFPKEVMDVMPSYAGGATFGLYLALLIALGVSAAFTYASFRKPLPLPFLQREGLSPLLQRHGALLAAQGLALLIGLAVSVARY